MYDILLFDLDGTLTDPKEGITKSFQYALQCCGVEEELENLNRVVGPPLIDSFMEFYGFDREKGLYAVEKYRERFAKIGIHENALFPGVPEMLRELRAAGKIITLATSKPIVFAEQILDEFKIAAYFHTAVGSELDGTRNYKIEVIQEVSRRLGNPDKNRFLMIGDRKQDVLGAKAFGIASLGVRFGYAEENELEEAGADYFADSVAELHGFLMKK